MNGCTDVYERAGRARASSRPAPSPHVRRAAPGSRGRPRTVPRVLHDRGGARGKPTRQRLRTCTSARAARPRLSDRSGGRQRRVRLPVPRLVGRRHPRLLHDRGAARARDTDNAADVYERAGGTTTLVSTGPGRQRRPRRDVPRGSRADGTRVFFETAERLVGSDTDGRPTSTSAPAVRRRCFRPARRAETASAALFKGSSAGGHAGVLPDRRALRSLRQRQQDRRVRALRRHHHAGLDGPGGRERSRRRALPGRLARRRRGRVRDHDGVDRGNGQTAVRPVRALRERRTTMLSTGPRAATATFDAFFAGMSRRRAARLLRDARAARRTTATLNRTCTSARTAARPRLDRHLRRQRRADRGVRRRPEDGRACSSARSESLASPTPTASRPLHGRIVTGLCATEGRHADPCRRWCPRTGRAPRPTGSTGRRRWPAEPQPLLQPPGPGVRLPDRRHRRLQRQADEVHRAVQLRDASRRPRTTPDEADVGLRLRSSDVRRKSDLADYTGELQARPRSASPTSTTVLPGRPRDGVGYRFLRGALHGDTDTSVGSTCAVDTRADALVPGAIKEGRARSGSSGQVEVQDGGADGQAATAPNTLFARQGIFVPKRLALRLRQHSRELALECGC